MLGNPLDLPCVFLSLCVLALKEHYSVNEQEKSGVVWPMEYFEKIMDEDGRKLITDQRALLLVLKRKSLKQWSLYNDRLTSRIEHLPDQFSTEYLSDARMDLGEIFHVALIKKLERRHIMMKNSLLKMELICQLQNH